jgi:hypothetical protein
VLVTSPAALRVIGGFLLLVWGIACSAGEDSAHRAGNEWRPWVEGGQTGALIPPCGISPAAAAGDSIPGGQSGIVLHTDECVGFNAAGLELHDEDGMLVAFDVVELPGNAVLIKPRSPLPAGVYSLTVAGKRMTPVIAAAPAAVPMRLGTITAGSPTCGVNLELTVDPLVLEYLPQLKLSVGVDGGPLQTWFDYGTLEVNDGRAQLSLDECFPTCLEDGAHSLRVIAELAGEPGTLEPIELTVQTACPVVERDDDYEDMSAACSAAGAGRGRATGGLVPLMALLIAATWRVRRARRSSA